MWKQGRTRFYHQRCLSLLLFPTKRTDVFLKPFNIRTHYGSEAGVDPYFCNNWHGALNLHLNPGTDPRSDHYRFVMVVSTEQRRWDPHARKYKQANSSLSSFHTSTIIRLFPAKFPTVLCLFLLLTLSASSQGRIAATGVNNTRLGKQGCMLWHRRKRRMVRVQAGVTPNQDGIQPPGKVSRHRL